MADTPAWWRFTVLLPYGWRREMREAAEANGVAVSDLVRMAVRSFLSGRYEARP
jgi:hypothetical protein